MQTTVGACLRLSPQQDQLWEIERAEGGAFFKTQCLVSVDGSLDKRCLEAALADLIGRHEILRTVFQQSSGSVPVQIVGDGAPAIIEEYDFSDLDAEEAQRRVRALYDNLLSRNTDLQTLSVLLIGVSEFKHSLVICVHSMCSDGAGLLNLVKELVQAYQFSGAGSCQVDYSRQEEDVAQYADLAEGFNILLESGAGRDYWQNKRLRGVTQIPLDLGSRRQPGQSFSPAILERAIAGGLARDLEYIALESGSSLKDLLLTCWAILIWRVTQTSDIVVGALYDGRTLDGLEKAVGLFARHLPVDIHLDACQTVIDLLKQVNRALDEIGPRQNYFNPKLAFQHSPTSESSSPYSVSFDFFDSESRVCGSGLTLAFPPRSVLMTSVLTKNPISPSISARLRPAIGVPTATSCRPAYRPSNA